MKKSTILIAMLLIGAGLAACTKAITTPDNAVKQENVVEQTEESAETENNTEQDSEMEDDNFTVPLEDAMAYGVQIKEAVKEKSLEKLADLTAFPVYVGLGEGMVIETREDFWALNPDEVFSDDMVSAIENSDETTLSPSMAGFTLMDETQESKASITFGLVNGELGIKGINY